MRKQLQKAGINSECNILGLNDACIELLITI